MKNRLRFIAFFSLLPLHLMATDLLPIPDKLIVLNFDDANKSDRTFVADVLKQHGFGATFYITEGLGFLKSKKNYLTWQEVKELHELGFEIGNHTQHHRNVTRLKPETLKQSLAHIDERCVEHDIAKPTTFCFPGFSHNENSMRVIEQHGFLFARRGIRPEFHDSGKGGRGPAYDPEIDHPLLIPTTGYAGPDWTLEDLKWAVRQARDGKIAVLCFHGVPAIEHPWVKTDPDDFKTWMQYLKNEGCTVIATRDLATYVDPKRRPEKPYEEMAQRTLLPRGLHATPIENPLGLRLNEINFEWAVGHQAAYRILVADDPKKLDLDIGNLWDSGWQMSKEQSDLAYDGSPLEADRSIWWKVRIQNSKGETGPFSETAEFKIEAPPKAQARKRSASAHGGSPAFKEGRFGQGLWLEARSPSIEIADHPTLRPRQATSLGAWIKPEHLDDNWRTIIRKENGDDRRLLSIGRTGKTWGLWIGLHIGGRYREFGAAYPMERLNDGQWHHVAGTYDGDALRLFVDGRQIGRRTESGLLGSTPGPYFIGSYSGKKEPFHGMIDDVRIYNRAGTTENQYEGLVGWWKLDGNLENDIAFIPKAPEPRVVFLGGTLMARMDRYGFLETALTAHWPHHHITFRNLGWPADDVFGTARSEFGSAHNTRSWRPPNAEEGFGYTTMMNQLEAARPAGLLVGYGAEAAFIETEEAYARFQDGYRHLLDALEKTGAHLTLLSPHPHETHEPPMPDATEPNQHLARASAFIEQLAEERGYGFIDLFTHLTGSETRLTENGVHLNREGYQRMTDIVLEQLGLAPGRETIEAQSMPFEHTLSRLPTRRPLRVTADGSAYRLKVNNRVLHEADESAWNQGVDLENGPDAEQVEDLRQLIVAKNQLHRYRIRPLNKTYIFLFRRYEMGHLADEMDRPRKQLPRKGRRRPTEGAGRPQGP
ncbi:MAG: LamG-like jellyroll fold domain-containing protein [Verrucomicrobiota bacterium]